MQYICWDLLFTSRGKHSSVCSVSDILHTASGWLGGAVLFSSVTILQTGLYVCFYEFVRDGVCSLCSILFDQGW